jgi:hypothetical protein
MYTFEEYCEVRDIEINEDWRDFLRSAKEKVSGYFRRPPPPPEEKVTIGGKRYGSEDVGFTDPGARMARLGTSPENAAIAARLGQNIASRMSNASLDKALINFGYTNQEAQEIIDANPSYRPLWNKYIIANEPIKNLYFDAWQKNERNNVRNMLRRMFDKAIGLNAIPMPALLVKSKEPEEKKRFLDIDIMREIKPLILQGDDPKKVADDVFFKFWQRGIHVPALKGRITRLVNSVVDKLNQQGKLGPRRIARGTTRVPAAEPVEPPSSLRLYR